MNQTGGANNEYRSGVYLLASRRFNREEELTGLHLILANTLLQGVDYDFDLLLEGEAFEGYTGHLAGGDMVMLSELPFEMMNAAPEVVTRIDTGGNQLEKTVRIKAKAVHQSIRHFEPMDISGVVYELYIQKQTSPVKTSGPRLNAELIRQSMLDGISYTDKFDLHEATHTIDLHFEQLAAHSLDPEAADKLDIQLQVFQQRLENAIAHGQHSLVVIHGKGTGQLKKAVHELLQQHPMVRCYEVSRSPQYDGGATEVFF